MSALDAILEYQDADFPSKPFVAPAGEQAWSSLLTDEAFASCLKEHNGFYAFDRALHVFGVDPSLPYHDLAVRNDVSASWRKSYGDILQDIVFFAEDVFGHLSGLRGKDAVCFDPESGEVEIVGQGFEGWLRFIDDDTDFATGQSLAQTWSEDKGGITFGTRLATKVPFVVGGEFDVENLVPMGWSENLGLMAGTYEKIKDLPDGAEVEFKAG
jgi:hypothetical protein